MKNGHTQEGGQVPPDSCVYMLDPPLDLEGRDIYVSEGCYTCHSQMVRPFRWETDRYGEYSKIGEFVYDHPFQWGSRRTGPDLARAGLIGGPMYKNAAWHYNHFMDPQQINEESIMPNYHWFADKEVDLKVLPAKIRAMRKLGVPYEEGYDKLAVEDLLFQAQGIVDELKASGIEIEPSKQMVAMIAYLHKMGRDIGKLNAAAEGKAMDESSSAKAMEDKPSSAKAMEDEE